MSREGGTQIKRLEWGATNTPECKYRRGSSSIRDRIGQDRIGWIEKRAMPKESKGGTRVILRSLLKNNIRSGSGANQEGVRDS